MFQTRSSCLKATISWFAIAAFLFVCVPAYATVDGKEVYTTDSWLQYAVTSSGLWLNENGTLKWLGESSYHPESIKVDNSIVHIAADVNGGNIWCLAEEHGVQTLYSLSAGGANVLNGVSISSDESIVQLEYSESFGLVALNHEGVVLSVYAADASLTPFAIEQWTNEGVSSISVWDNYLLTYKEISGELTLIDMECRSCAIPAITVPSLSWVQVGTVSNEETYVFALNKMSGDLIRIDMNNGTQEIVETDLPRDCAGLRRNENYIYTLGNSFRTLYALSITELLGGNGAKKLTIVNSVGDVERFKKAVLLFKTKYPDIEVVERSIDDPRIIATEIMSGNEGIDIVGLQDSNMPISAALLLKSGALVNLNQVADLVSLKDEYRDIWGFVTIEDQWYGIPQTVEQHLWRVNLELASKIGWEPPVGRWTWDDFSALAEKVLTYNASAETPIYLLQEDTFLLPYFFHEFQANHVKVLNGSADYMSDEYIELLKMWKYLNDSHLVCSSAVVWSPSMRADTLLYSNRVSLATLGDNCYIYPPTESASSVFPVYSAVLALNANTPYLSEATFFLMCYMSPEAVSSSIYWNDGQWLSNKELYTEQGNMYKISASNEALWNDMLTVSAPELYLLDIMRQQSKTLLPGLLDGTVSPEKYAAISQQMADIVLGE